MTTDIERQFFETFGIEPKIIDIAVGRGFYIEHNRIEKYPQITDSILLELICIATASEITVEFKGIKNVEHLKEVVLNYFIERYGYCLHKDNFKHQVRTLFEEG